MIPPLLEYKPEPPFAVVTKDFPNLDPDMHIEWLVHRVRVTNRSTMTIRALRVRIAAITDPDLTDHPWPYPNAALAAVQGSCIIDLHPGAAQFFNVFGRVKDNAGPIIIAFDDRRLAPHFHFECRAFTIVAQGRNTPIEDSNQLTLRVYPSQPGPFPVGVSSG